MQYDQAVESEEVINSNNSTQHISFEYVTPDVTNNRGPFRRLIDDTLCFVCATLFPGLLLRCNRLRESSAWETTSQRIPASALSTCAIACRVESSAPESPPLPFLTTRVSPSPHPRLARTSRFSVMSGSWLTSTVRSELIERHSAP